MKFSSLYKVATVCGLVVLLTTACYSDQGNYDYHEINEVTITGIDRENVYQAYAYQSTLEITPEIHSSMDVDPSQYEYTWRIVPRDADTNKGATLDEFIVSHERNLVYPVQLSDGDYTGFFEVKDPSTGVTWVEDFYLHVFSQGSDGWLIACDDNGRTRLDLIGKDSKGEKDVLYPDLWKNLDFEMGSPKKLFFIGDDFGMEFRFPILVAENGSYAINGNDFDIGEETNLKWYFGLGGDNIQITQTAVELNRSDWAPYWWVITDKGEIYVTDCDDIAFFSYPINLYEGTTQFEAAPFIGLCYTHDWAFEKDYAVAFYDKTNKRFLAKFEANNYPTLMTCSGTQLFDVTTNRDMVFMDSQIGITGGLQIAVLKDPDSPNYYLYGFALEPSKITQKYYGKIGGPVADVKFFAAHPKFHALFYATTDNKIYRVDYDNLKGEDMTSQAIEVLSLNEEIAVMKFNKNYCYASSSEALSYTDMLLVCTNKTSIAGDDPNVGTFRLYDVPEFASDPMTLNREINGLGKIVDAVYKEPAGS